jgi:ankyrin repeat protein
VLFDVMRISYGKPDPVYDMMSFLVEKGADINFQRSGDGATLLLLALESQVEARSLNVASFLLDHKINVNPVNRSAWTPLHAAVKKRSYDIVARMLEMGADVTAVDGQFWTALHMAPTWAMPGLSNYC